MLVIGIALALPTCLHLLITNAQKASGDWNRAVDISVFLKRSTSQAEAKQLADRLRQRRDIAQIDFITADALKQFRHDSGFGAAIDALTDNPLPHTLILHPKAEFADAGHLQGLAEDVRAMPSVDVVQLDTAWVNRLHAILDAVRKAVLLTAALLGVGVMVIVGNTIRLDIQNRRAEIEVTKLSAVAVGVLRNPVTRIADLYGSSFQIIGLDLRASAILVGSAVVLGWLGSYVAASRHIRAIEPA